MDLHEFTPIFTSKSRKTRVFACYFQFLVSWSPGS